MFRLAKTKKSSLLVAWIQSGTIHKPRGQKKEKKEKETLFWAIWVHFQSVSDRFMSNSGHFMSTWFMNAPLELLILDQRQMKC